MRLPVIYPLRFLIDLVIEVVIWYYNKKNKKKLDKNADT